MMMDKWYKKMNESFYQKHKHRGVEFFINDVCSGLGENRPMPGVHFSRFFTLEETEQCGPSHPNQQRIEIIKKAIDRMLARSPIYNGDLRDRRYGNV